MNKEHYRYVFAPTVPPEEVQGSLLLALFAVESLHGEAQVCLDAAHYFDAEVCVCVINATTAVGRDLNRLFAGFLRREFGAQAFTVERLGGADLPNACKTPAAT
jgi:hypothetical protein